MSVNEKLLSQEAWSKYPIACERIDKVYDIVIQLLLRPNEKKDQYIPVATQCTNLLIQAMIHCNMGDMSENEILELVAFANGVLAGGMFAVTESANLIETRIR